MQKKLPLFNKKCLPIFLFIGLIGIGFTLQAQDKTTTPKKKVKKVKLSKNTFGALRARQLGPAVMSGRIAALDAVNSDPRIIYVGAASGGVWKTKNTGTTFKPVFDKHPQSIGAITIDQNHPDTVWVGTGEPWTRNSTSVGNGVYKTTNGGEKWKNMGLKETERIGKIIVHPTNPDIVWVAALGHLWGANEERGVFKTTDGGKNWEKVLYIDKNTGASSLTIDPRNPDILYAGMWDFRRTAYDFRSGGPGSGLYKSTDGGQTWNKLSKDLPEGTVGRICVAMSTAEPYHLYALVESDKSALYRSEDGGDSWTRTSKVGAMAERPFYFSLIVPDPVKGDRIYKPGFSLVVSNDAGETFASPFVEGGAVHSDLHALWVNPNNNNDLYVGTDGGLYISTDKGNTWRFIENLPLSQFYHVSADMQEPYNVFGGLQDNGSWIGPSRSAGGITNADWKNVGYGDGFSVLVDKSDDQILYWQYQGGKFMRHDLRTNEFKLIRPYAENAKEILRYNWDAAIALSPNDDNTLYVGAQYLFRSKDKGNTWEKISPDLTTNDPKKLKQEESGGLTIDNSTAENHCSIVTIAESPKNAQVIWVGTDDGNLQVSQNAGGKWTNTTPNIEGLPANTWVTFIEASPHDAATAYVAFDGHRNDDKNAYLYKTTDYGQTWTALATKDIKAYCRSIRQDIVNPNLLFLGTEWGLYISIDDGKKWVRFTGEVPPVPILDMMIHPRENDLILGTHGRGIMILDDITPLRQMSLEFIEQDVAFLDSRPFLIRNPGGMQNFPGDQGYYGSNPTTDAVITYYLKKRHVFGDMFLEIFDKDGNLIQKIPAGKRKGINRVNWGIRKRPPRVPSSPTLVGGAIFGPTVPTGTYTVKLTKGEDTYNTTLDVAFDPNSPHTVTEREAQYDAVIKAYDMLEGLAFTVRQIKDISDQAKKTSEDSEDDNLTKQLTDLADKMEGMRKELVATKEGSITGEVRLREKLGEIYGAISNYTGKPTQSEITQLTSITKEIKAVQQTVDQVMTTELVAVNKALETAELTPIKVISKVDYDKEMGGGGASPQPMDKKYWKALKRQYSGAIELFLNTHTWR